MLTDTRELKDIPDGMYQLASMVIWFKQQVSASIVNLTNMYYFTFFFLC